jgi:hypothetical protein
MVQRQRNVRFARLPKGDERNRRNLARLEKSWFVQKLPGRIHSKKLIFKTTSVIAYAPWARHDMYHQNRGSLLSATQLAGLAHPCLTLRNFSAQAAPGDVMREAILVLEAMPGKNVKE